MTAERHVPPGDDTDRPAPVPAPHTVALLALDAITSDATGGDA